MALGAFSYPDGSENRERRNLVRPYPILCVTPPHARADGAGRGGRA